MGLNQQIERRIHIETAQPINLPFIQPTTEKRTYTVSEEVFYIRNDYDLFDWFSAYRDNQFYTRFVFELELLEELEGYLAYSPEPLAQIQQIIADYHHLLEEIQAFETANPDVTITVDFEYHAS